MNTTAYRETDVAQRLDRLSLMLSLYVVVLDPLNARQTHLSPRSVNQVQSQWQKRLLKVHGTAW